MAAAKLSCEHRAARAPLMLKALARGLEWQLKVGGAFMVMKKNKNKQTNKTLLRAIHQLPPECFYWEFCLTVSIHEQILNEQ